MIIENQTENIQPSYNEPEEENLKEKNRFQ